MIGKNRICLVALTGIILLQCLNVAFAEPKEGSRSKPKIHLGIDVLEKVGFKQLKGMRVGLLTNPAGVNRNGVSTIDVLRRAPQVNLVALYGPEHGIYGDEKANVPVLDKIDKRTGLPVFSLYGKYRKPTKEMLDKIDILVIDLQGLGTRSYTYISCMRYCMEACFTHNTKVMVLDRPNPLGGLKVDGPPLDDEWMSYVGAFQVPYVHGMTIGEIARMSKRTPNVLKIDDDVRLKGKLTIVPMSGWKRSMRWSETGLNWVATSPAIQDYNAAVGYPMTGLGTQLGNFSHGYGTPWAFRLLSYKGKSADEIYAVLKRRNIPGLDYVIHQYKDKKKRPKEGVYVKVVDWNKWRPTELNFHMMQIAAAWDSKNPFKSAKKSLQGLYNKHVGSNAWWKEISTRGADADVRKFVTKWAKDAAKFREWSRKFYIYD